MDVWDVLCREKAHGFMQLLSLKNRFRARFPSKHHRQLLHQDHLQSICSEGTILELQIIKEFHRQFIHQHHLQSHLFCGNDPTITNHNEILSTTNARNTGDTPFTMRNRSEYDPRMIDPWKISDFVHLLSLKTHFLRDFLQH